MEKKDHVQQMRTVLILEVLLFFSGFLVYWDYVFGNHFLAFGTFADVGSDTVQQYLMHYHSVVNHIRNGNVSFWDFNNGFGINVFQMNLFDPTLILLYLIGLIRGANHIWGALVYVQILRILLAGLAGYLFLSEFQFSERSKLLAAYIYGLNGFLMVWGQHYQFGIITIYLPLLLLFAERTFRKKRYRSLLPLIVFLTVIDSTYLAYMSCLTTGVYLIFRVLLVTELPVKERLNRFLRVCLGMLLGVLMGLCVLLPSAYVIFGVTSRMESDSTLVQRLLEGFRPMQEDSYLTLLYRFFSANLLNKNGDYKGYGNYYEDPSVFASIFLVIFGVQYLCVLWRSRMSHYKKCVFYGAAGLIAFCLLFPLAGIIFNGCSVYMSRFTFVFLPFFALLIAWMTDFILAGEKLCIPALIATGALSVCIYISGWKLTSQPPQKQLILGMLAVSVLAMAVLLAGQWLKDPKYQKGFCTVLLLLAVADMCMEGKGTVTDRGAVEKNDTTCLLDLYNEDVKNALAWLKETDTGFYRVEKTYLEGIASMTSLAQDYSSISTYNSMQNGNVKNFVFSSAPDLLFDGLNYYCYSEHPGDGRLPAFLGVRYLLSKEGDPVPDTYVFVRSFGTISVYQAKDDVGIVSFYRAARAMTNDAFRRRCRSCHSQQSRNKVLLARLGVEESQEEIENYQEEAKKNGSTGPVKKTAEDNYAGDRGTFTLEKAGNDSHLTGTAEVPSDGYLLITVPYEGGWELTLDGEKQEILKADLGFMGVRVRAGSHTFSLDYHPPLLKEGCILSLIGWLIYLLYLAAGVRNNRKNKRGVNIS